MLMRLSAESQRDNTSASVSGELAPRSPLGMDATLASRRHANHSQSIAHVRFLLDDDASCVTPTRAVSVAWLIFRAICPRSLSDLARTSGISEPEFLDLLKSHHNLESRLSFWIKLHCAASEHLRGRELVARANHPTRIAAKISGGETRKLRKALQEILRQHRSARLFQSAFS